MLRLISLLNKYNVLLLPSFGLPEIVIFMETWLRPLPFVCVRESNMMNDWGPNHGFTYLFTWINFFICLIVTKYLKLWCLSSITGCFLVEACFWLWILPPFYKPNFEVFSHTFGFNLVLLVSENWKDMENLAFDFPFWFYLTI